MLQLRRPFKALNPDWCILCRRSKETIDHLFLHCLMTLGLWHKIFSQAGMEWVQPSSICDMLVISFKCFGNSIRGKTLWRIASLSLLWIVWREKCQDFLGHLEDAGDDVGLASFLCFFLGLLYRHFKTLSFECNPTQLASVMYTLGLGLEGQDSFTCIGILFLLYSHPWVSGGLLSSFDHVAFCTSCMALLGQWRFTQFF